MRRETELYGAVLAAALHPIERKIDTSTTRQWVCRDEVVVTALTSHVRVEGKTYHRDDDEQWRESTFTVSLRWHEDDKPTLFVDGNVTLSVVFALMSAAVVLDDPTLHNIL